MKKFIKLINNERSQKKITAQLAVSVGACDGTSFDKCTETDAAHCYSYSYDMCGKDLATCFSEQYDFCSNEDNSLCVGQPSDVT
jgi:hypothetical protein